MSSDRRQIKLFLLQMQYEMEQSGGSWVAISVVAIKLLVSKDDIIGYVSTSCNGEVIISEDKKKIKLVNYKTKEQKLSDEMRKISNIIMRMENHYHYYDD